MLIFKHDTQIGGYQFKGIVSYSTVSTWDTVSDTGTVEVPRDVDLQGKEISEVFKRGTPLSIKAGYNQGLADVFTGFISDIVIDSPMNIKIQDLGWYLKQINIKKSLTGAVALTQIIQLIVDKVEEKHGFKIPFVITAEFNDMGNQRYTNADGLAILNNLKKKYKAYSYFRNGTLYAGLRYPNIDQNTFLFWLDGDKNNTVNAGANLDFKRGEDIRVQIKATSYYTDANGKQKKRTATAGVEGGKVVSRQAYNLGETELQNFADTELELIRFDGYTGYITIFGLPDVKHGDIVELKSVKFPERDGRYLVKKVEKSMSVSGGLRQKVYIDLKI